MNQARFLPTLLACGVLAFLSGCEAMHNPRLIGTGVRKRQARVHKSLLPPLKPAFWNEEDAEGEPKIVAHLGEQRAYFYKGKTLVGESSISTGRKGFDTPPGHYRVIQKDENHISNLYGDYVNHSGQVVKRNIDTTKDPQPAGTHFVGAPMHYFLRFTRGYGMHAGFVPRFRASHGCIRMPTEMARHFFQGAQDDTPVTVTD